MTTCCTNSSLQARLKRCIGSDVFKMLELRQSRARLEMEVINVPVVYSGHGELRPG
jgi:hypothetical protein